MKKFFCWFIFTQLMTISLALFCCDESKDPEKEKLCTLKKIDYESARILPVHLEESENPIPVDPEYFSPKFWAVLFGWKIFGTKDQDQILVGKNKVTGMDKYRFKVKLNEVYRKAGSKLQFDLPRDNYDDDTCFHCEQKISKHGEEWMNCCGIYFHTKCYQSEKIYKKLKLQKAQGIRLILAGTISNGNTVEYKWKLDSLNNFKINDTDFLMVEKLHIVKKGNKLNDGISSFLLVNSFHLAYLGEFKITTNSGIIRSVDDYLIISNHDSGQK